MVEAIGVDDFVRTAQHHGDDMAGTTDLACVIRGIVEASARYAARLRANGWVDLEREVNRHAAAYEGATSHLSGSRPGGRDLVILQARLAQPLWQDAHTAEPVIQIVKSLPIVDAAVIGLIGDDPRAAKTVQTLQAAAERLSEAADMFAPDYDPSAKLSPEVEDLVRRISNEHRQDPSAGQVDKPRRGPKI